MLKWISERKRCVTCGLVICGCATVGYITSTFWSNEAKDSEGHKVRLPISMTMPASGTTTSTLTVSGVNLAMSYLDRAVGDSVLEKEYRARAYEAAPMAEVRPADVSFYQLPSHQVATIRFGWEMPAKLPRKI